MNLDPQEVKTLFFISIGILVCSGLIVGKLMYAITKNHDSNQLHLKQLALEHENIVMAAKLEMQEDTFQQIARELHDNVKLSFRFINMHQHTLLKTAGNKQEELIRNCIQMAEKGITDLDDLSLSLNTDWIMQIGLICALEQEIEKLEITGLYDVESFFSQNQVVIDAERELLIFRIAQEAFSNIIKHAGAKKIGFSLQYNPDHVCLTITDDGKGFDNTTPEKKRRGTGLNNIQLRVKVLNAGLTIDTMAGKGTSLSVSVPYNANHPVRQK